MQIRAWWITRAVSEGKEEELEQSCRKPALLYLLVTLRCETVIGGQLDWTGADTVGWRGCGSQVPGLPCPLLLLVAL